MFHCTIVTAANLSSSSYWSASVLRCKTDNFAMWKFWQDHLTTSDCFSIFWLIWQPFENFVMTLWLVEVLWWPCWHVLMTVWCTWKWWRSRPDSLCVIWWLSYDNSSSWHWWSLGRHWWPIRPRRLTSSSTQWLITDDLSDNSVKVLWQLKWWLWLPCESSDDRHCKVMTQVMSLDYLVTTIVVNW